MDNMMAYFKKVDAKRMIIMVLGNIFLGMGISIFKLSGMGNDPFSGMVMALAEVSGIVYANFLILLNLVLFIFQFTMGRRLIGAGTIVNAIFLGYIVTFFYNTFIHLFGEPQLFGQRLVVVIIGVVVCSFGVSLYQTSDVGVAPYDSLSLIMVKRMPKISYFWHRMFTDALCALICFLAGGIVGLGTLVCALALGPIIQFFDVNFTRKLLAKASTDSEHSITPS